MKRGLVIAVVVALVLALAVPAALALTDSQKAELEELYRQQHELRLRILEKQVEAGLVDTEQAEFFRQKMERMWQYRQERMAKGEYGFGFRRGGRGSFGRLGGCGNCPVNNNGPEL